MSDENEPVDSEVTSTPDLTDIRQLDDGGATALIGLKYQYHFAAYKCLEMLSNPGQIEYVACELHDDVTIRLRNGTYEFYQVKERRGDLWKISTLKSEGVWERFWWLKGEFGDNNKFLFVSDQSAQSRVSNKPDLAACRRDFFPANPICGKLCTCSDDVDMLLAGRKAHGSQIQKS